jgi:hypothetical protein
LQSIGGTDLADRPENSLNGKTMRAAIPRAFSLCADAQGLLDSTVGV